MNYDHLAFFLKQISLMTKCNIALDGLPTFTITLSDSERITFVLKSNGVIAIKEVHLEGKLRVNFYPSGPGQDENLSSNR